MKKGKICGIIALIVAIVLSVSVPILNNYTAEVVKKEIERIPLPDNTEYMESVSKAGKLTGNGNGMQYLGAILVKSELSLDELKDYYSNYNKNKMELVVELQNGSHIACVDHEDILFSSEMSMEEPYYIVYAWGQGTKIFSELDIRGN